MATTVITSAPALRQAGAQGPFAAASAVIFSPAGYAVNFTNGADWPTAGDVAVVTVEVRVGAIWQFDAALTMGAGPWKDGGGNTINAGAWLVSTPPNANGIRVSLNMLQAATLGLTVQTL